MQNLSMRKRTSEQASLKLAIWDAAVVIGIIFLLITASCMLYDAIDHQARRSTHSTLR